MRKEITTSCLDLLPQPVVPSYQEDADRRDYAMHLEDSLATVSTDDSLSDSESSGSESITSHLTINTESITSHSTVNTEFNLVPGLVPIPKTKSTRFNPAARLNRPRLSKSTQKIHFRENLQKMENNLKGVA